MKARFLLAALCLALPVTASADPPGFRARAASSADDQQAAEGAREVASALHLGLEPVEKDLQSDDYEVRERALMQAADINTDASWKLVESASTTASTGDSDAIQLFRITATRVLCRDPHADDARDALEKIFTSAQSGNSNAANSGDMGGSRYNPRYGYGYGYGSRPPAQAAEIHSNTSEELATRLSQISAMSLALIGDHSFFVSQTDTNGERPEAIARALAIYPPSTLPNLYAESTFASLAPSMDLRLASHLQSVVTMGDSATGLSSLVTIGDDETFSIEAKKALSHAPSDEVRMLFAEGLAAFGAPEAASQIGSLLDTEATRARGRQVALLFPRRELASTFETLARGGDAGAMFTLARLGKTSVPALLKMAKDSPKTRDDAMLALANIADSSASSALSTFAESTDANARRSFLRASIFRLARWSDAPSGANAVAKKWFASKDLGEKFLGALFLALDSASFARELVSNSTVLLQRAGALAITAKRDQARWAHDYLREKQPADPTVRELLELAMAPSIDGQIAHDLPFSDDALFTLANADDSIAAFSLATRPSSLDDERTERGFDLAGRSAKVGALMGLAFNPNRRAIGILKVFAENEPDQLLRKTAVRALIQRGDNSLKDFFGEIRTLEGDIEIRGLMTAYLANTGATIKHYWPADNEVLVINIVRTDNIDHAIHLVLENGLRVPAVAGPDGSLFSFGTQTFSHLDVE